MIARRIPHTNQPFKFPISIHHFTRSIGSHFRCQQKTSTVSGLYHPPDVVWVFQQRKRAALRAHRKQHPNWAEELLSLVLLGMEIVPPLAPPFPLLSGSTVALHLLVAWSESRESVSYRSSARKHGARACSERRTQMPLCWRLDISWREREKELELLWVGRVGANPFERRAVEGFCANTWRKRRLKAEEIRFVILG